MHRILSVVASCFLLGAVPLTASELFVPEQVKTGDVLPAYVDDIDPGSHVVVDVVESDGSVYQTTRAYRVESSAESALYAALFGISVWADPGEYEVRVTVFGPEERRRQDPETLSRLVELVEGDFRSERIRLNKAMSELRTSKDPRKAEQTRELLALLARYRLTAVYETGSFELPVEEYRTTSYFGDRRTFVYVDGGTAGAVHAGLDLAASVGTAVHAAGRGRVVFAGHRIVTGNSVIIEHLPGVFSLYYHLDRMTVGSGELVKRGQRIGDIGATGLVTGPHLHWELRVNGIAVRPDALVEAGVVDKARQLGIMSETTQ